MRIPRLVITPELMGKTLGRPKDTATQRRYLETALGVLANATKGDTLLDLSEDL
jgi:hypothetical protein